MGMIQGMKRNVKIFSLLFLNLHASAVQQHCLLAYFIVLLFIYFFSGGRNINVCSFECFLNFKILTINRMLQTYFKSRNWI